MAKFGAGNPGKPFASKAPGMAPPPMGTAKMAKPMGTPKPAAPIGKGPSRAFRDSKF